MRVRMRMAFGLLTICLLLVTACGSDDDDNSSSDDSGSETTMVRSNAFDEVIEAGKSEGTVTLYTVAQQATLDLITTAFAEEYPEIELNIFRGNTGEVITRLTTEQEAGTPGADVVIVNTDGPTSTLETYDSEGLLTAPEGPNVLAEDFAAAIEDNHFWVYAQVFGWAWNTQLLPDGIDSWDDFLSDDLSDGKIAVFDPAQSSLIPSCYASQVEGSGDPDFLEGLGAQQPRIYPGGQAQENAVASGEVAATAFASKRILELQEQGAAVDFAVPEEGACVAGNQGGILADAPHPNAAQVFVDWLASDAGQTPFLGSGTPAKSNVPGNDIDFASLEPTSPVTADDQSEFVDEFNSLFT